MKLGRVVWSGPITTSPSSRLSVLYRVESSLISFASSLAFAVSLADDFELVLSG